MPEPRRIPLHDFHARHGARFVDFGGWNMPVQYTSILEEHRAVREAAGLFDVSHMGEFLLEGPAAPAFLDHLLTNRISPAPVGKAVYSPMCAEDGGVVDDLIVYRTGEQRYLLCVNAGNIEKDFSWITQQLEAFGEELHFEDQSDRYGLLALQGPHAAGILQAAGFAAAASLGRFRHCPTGFQGGEIRICRTGYTGEDGFEIYVSPEQAEALAEALMAAGQSYGLKLCGLGARDSLRLEAGLPLYGHELSATLSPLEAGLGWAVKLDKTAFIGKDALQAQQSQGLQRQVAFFKLEDRRIARAGTAVIDADGKVVGEVLSGTSSPITGGPIGSALIEAAALAAPLRVDLRGNPIQLHLAQPPLHRA